MYQKFSINFILAPCFEVYNSIGENISLDTVFLKKIYLKILKNFSLYDNPYFGKINRKIFFNNLLTAVPALGTAGGNGDRIILYTGGTNAYPYSIGIADFTQFYSVPFGSVHRMFIAGSNIFQVGGGGVVSNVSLTTNGNINITSSGTNSLIFDTLPQYP